MSLMHLLFLAFVPIVLVVMDVAFLLLLIRILRQWSSNKMLVAFDQAGAPIVDKCCEITGRAWTSLGLPPLSTKGCLLITVLDLMISRWFVSLFFTMAR